MFYIAAIVAVVLWVVAAFAARKEPHDSRKPFGCC
jgi:hypothetical protein